MLEMNPGPGGAYFQATVNRGSTWTLPWYFWTWPAKIFLTRSQKTEKFGILGGTFSDLEVGDRTRPEQQKNYPAQLVHVIHLFEFSAESVW